MNSLIINTANKNLVIVLQKDEQVFLSVSEKNSYHNEELLPMIDRILSGHNLKIKDIDKFGVVVGPGSFTGIRVGIATVKAFRDVLNVKAYGINNLDILYALATEQYDEIGAVAIAGSGNTYFVARNVNGIVYKYNRNLSLEELLGITKGKPIAMFEEDKNIDAEIVKIDAKVLLECLNSSTDEQLVPVYYQLSQAEREKLKAGELKIQTAKVKDLDEIFNLENEISTSPLTKPQIAEMLTDKNYVPFVALFNNQIVGFVIFQKTDELSVVSIAVNKDFRNLGIATKLMQEGEEYYKKNNFKTISLEVGEKNITAFLLYEKLGFKIRRKRKNYYADGQTCLEMEKEIKF